MVMYTGGYNALLWAPLNGQLSFDIQAYRFDITPFAGVLNDGKSHSFKIEVFENNGNWVLDPVLLFFRDENYEQISGKILNIERI